MFYFFQMNKLKNLVKKSAENQANPRLPEDPVGGGML